MQYLRFDRWCAAIRRITYIILISLIPVVSCGQEQTPQFSGEVAWSYLVKQCDYGPRVPGSSAHDSTKAFITRHLSSAGAQVSLQRFEMEDPYGARPLVLTNIIGSFFPHEKKRFLVAAHYDTRPWADEDEDERVWEQPNLGANDGASGVAVILHLADILARAQPQGLGVDLVCFDGEDYGKAGDLQYYLLGSKYFAANLDGYRPRAAVVLDMVGGRGAQIRQEGNSLDHAAELTRKIFRRAQELNLDVFVPQRFQPIYDDHVPLLRAGIPTVDLIGLPYAYWHTLEDTPDKCSSETLNEVGTLMVDLIYRFLQ